MLNARKRSAGSPEAPALLEDAFPIDRRSHEALLCENDRGPRSKGARAVVTPFLIRTEGRDAYQVAGSRLFSPFGFAQVNYGKLLA